METKYPKKFNFRCSFLQTTEYFSIEIELQKNCFTIYRDKSKLVESNFLDITINEHNLGNPGSYYLTLNTLNTKTLRIEHSEWKVLQDFYISIGRMIKYYLIKADKINETLQHELEEEVSLLKSSTMMGSKIDNSEKKDLLEISKYTSLKLNNFQVFDYSFLRKFEVSSYLTKKVVEESLIDNKAEKSKLIFQISH